MQTAEPSSVARKHLLRNSPTKPLNLMNPFGWSSAELAKVSSKAPSVVRMTKINITMNVGRINKQGVTTALNP